MSYFDFIFIFLKIRQTIFLKIEFDVHIVARLMKTKTKTISNNKKISINFYESFVAFQKVSTQLHMISFQQTQIQIALQKKTKSKTIFVA